MYRIGMNKTCVDDCREHDDSEQCRVPFRRTALFGIGRCTRSHPAAHQSFADDRRNGPTVT